MSFAGAKQEPKVNLGTMGSQLQGAYPTPYDAAFAKQSGFGYGTGMEPFLSGQQATILVDAKGRPASGSGLPSELATDESKSKTVEPAPEGYGTKMTQAALAANRIPIAALGFDPEKMNIDVKSDRATGGVVGSQANDRIYAKINSSNPNDKASTPVHESIHRGLEMLQKSPNAVKLPWDFDEELLVRAMMAKFGGDPEKGSGPKADELRAAGVRKYQQQKFEDPRLNPYIGLLDRINEAAQREIKRRRPERFAR